MENPKNQGKQWTEENIQQLKKLVDQNTPTRLIALKLARTEDSVRSKAGALKISLKPTNQSPYNRRKK